MTNLYQKTKKGIRRGLLSGLVALGLSGCLRNSNSNLYTCGERIEDISDIGAEGVHYANAKDGSTVLVIKDTTNKVTFYRSSRKTGEIIDKREGFYFNFFRDRNHDGWADSKGEGYYECGIGRVLLERKISDSLNLKELEKKHKQ